MTEQERIRRLEDENRELRALMRPTKPYAQLDPDDPSDAIEIAFWAEGASTARALRFVAELATMTDIECEMIPGERIRSHARLLALDERVTFPRLYGAADEDRAVAMLAQATRNGHKPREVVELVAEALGMRKA